VRVKPVLAHRGIRIGPQRRDQFALRHDRFGAQQQHVQHRRFARGKPDDAALERQQLQFRIEVQAAGRNAFGRGAGGATTVTRFPLALPTEATL
jgi:hypothetical protein